MALIAILFTPRRPPPWAEILGVCKLSSSMKTYIIESLRKLFNLREARLRSDQLKRGAAEAACPCRRTSWGEFESLIKDGLPPVLSFAGL